jgi:abequosyltransferase
MNPIKLSICIATLNRAAFIGATIESIIAQAADEVEIVIVDGASVDNTEEIVRGYQTDFPQLHYVRRDTNMGVDQDFAKAVELARGEYCWLFSDDDLMKPGAVLVVFEAIKRQYGLIILNAEVRNFDLSKLLEPRRLRLNADHIYEPQDGHRLMADVGSYLSFIGCVIIKRQLWNSREKEKYFGSFFVHVGVIFQKPLPEDTLVVAEPLISIRYGNAMWHDKYFEIWMFKWPALIWSFAYCTDEAKAKVCPREPWRRARTLLLQRAKGAYTIMTYRKWLKPRLNRHWNRLKYLAIAHLPARLANALATTYFLAFSHVPGQPLQLVDLKNSPVLNADSAATLAEKASPELS